MEDSRPGLSIELMPQQAGLRAIAEDWTGVTDRKERRKLQNRLNQRAWSELQDLVPGVRAMLMRYSQKYVGLNQKLNRVTGADQLSSPPLHHRTNGSFLACAL